MRIAFFALLVMALASCEMSTFGDPAATVSNTANRNFYPDENVLVQAKVHFKAGNYGKAHTLYKKAIDVYPTDPNAWLGYAAASDMLRRFDKSDIAYRKLKPVIGHRVEYLNNYGYSMLLRGNLRAARTYFVRAYEIDPSNEITANNLEMMRNSVSYPKRARGDLKSI